MNAKNPGLALLGAGLMGTAMAERLRETGHPLVVWNRTPSKTMALDAGGTSIAGTAREAVQAAQGVILMLADVTAIRETLLGGATREAIAGRTILQMGTIAPDESHAVAEEVARAGGSYLEAPVLGSVPQARQGTLLIMAGGDEALWGRWRGVLADMGRPRLVGGIGQAAALKLALNNVIASHVTGYALSLGLVRRAGVDRELFAEILRDSPFYSKSFDAKLPGMLQGSFTPANFPARHLLKDVRLVQAEAKHLGLMADHLQGVATLLERTVAEGRGDEDYSTVASTIDPPE